MARWPTCASAPSPRRRCPRGSAATSECTASSPMTDRSVRPRSRTSMTNIALTGLARELAEREDAGRPVRIGLVGCGEMGTDIVTQVSRMRGIRVTAIAETDPDKAMQAVAIAGLPQDAARFTDRDLAATIEAGRIAVTSDASLVTACD